MKPGLLASVFVIAAFLLCLLLTNSLVGQQVAQQPAPSKVGKYQLSVVASRQVQLYLLDTETGQLWSQHEGHKWFEVASPVKAPAK